MRPLHSERHLLAALFPLVACALVVLACSDDAVTSLELAPDAWLEDTGGDVADVPTAQDTPPADVPEDTPAPVYPPAPAVDGDFSEWTEADLRGTDPRGDAGALFDVKRVYARSQGTTLYVHFDIGASLNLQAGGSTDGGLQLQIELPQSSLTIDFRGQTVYRDGDPSQWIAWHRLDLAMAPTYASDQFELRIDLSEVGAEVGDELALSFTGSDRTDAVSFPLGAPAAELPPLRDHRRAEATRFRIASLNTQESGLSNPERAAAIGRLLAQPDADIYCFQEETDTQDSAAAFALRSITGRDGWNIHKIRGTIIATTSAMVPVESDSRRFAAARVTLPDQSDVLIISYHGNCCGHAGSEEDRRRVSEAQAIARVVRAHPDIPAVVIGDWNLVGSRSPLTTVENEGLTRWLLESLRPGHFWTWYSRRSRFSPGQLDILVYDDQRLEALNGYILSTHVMRPEEAEELGLARNDSNGTDHQLLVADFR